MTCRHEIGDPGCSKTKYLPSPTTPDAENYTVVKMERVGEHLVLQVNYPNCAECKFEGNKIMVFLCVSELETMNWKRIDPHFRDTQNRSATEAPSPAARFPGNAGGWEDALVYARGK